MALIIAGVLIIGGLVGTVVLVVSIPMFFGLMAYDVMESRKAERERTPEARATDAEGRIFLERGIARGFVIAGGVFWAIAIFAGMYVYGRSAIGPAMMVAFLPLVATVATLVIGWYYERVASVLLALASVAVVAWGVIYQFEMGVWMIMTIVLIGPMATAAVLFWMARSEEVALELALSRQPELASISTASE